MLPVGPAVDVRPPGSSFANVAHRAGVDDVAAQRAIEAVLTTLGSLIAGGEVDDLIARLPSCCTRR